MSAQDKYSLQERGRFKAWWDAARPLEGSAFPYEIAWAAWQAALSAQPSPGGQDALASLPLYRLADDANGNRGLHRDDTGSWVKLQDVERAAPPAQPVGIGDAIDRALSEVIDQRDRCEEVADELADHIARITGVDIGEHSSANCPWQNAIEAAEEYKPAQAVGLGAVREALQAAEGLATVCASVDGYSREEVAASGRAMRQQFADALAKVDSQAVGNG